MKTRGAASGSLRMLFPRVKLDRARRVWTVHRPSSCIFERPPAGWYDQVSAGTIAGYESLHSGCGRAAFLHDLMWLIVNSGSERPGQQEWLWLPPKYRIYRQEVSLHVCHCSGTKGSSGHTFISNTFQLHDTTWTVGVSHSDSSPHLATALGAGANQILPSSWKTYD